MLYYPNVLLMDLDQQNLWEKLFLKKDTLSKDADHWLASFHEISISHRCSSMCKSNMWLISGTFCADGLLRFITFTELPWKSIYDFIISLKEWRVYFKPLLHGRTSVYQEHIECILVFVIRVPEFQKAYSNRSGKQKSLTCNNCSNLLRQLQQGFETKFARKIEWQTFWKKKSKRRIPGCGTKFGWKKEQ